jgi:hypothetical protein
MSSEVIKNVLSEALKDTYLMIPVLFVLYFILEYLSHEKGIDIIAVSKISGKFGPVAGTILGIIPQCGMSVFMTSLFLSRKITIGTLVATYIATSDEALPVLFAHLEHYNIMVYIIIIKFAGGISAGYLVDLLIKQKYYAGKLREVFSSKIVEIKQELEKTKYLEIIRHSLNKTVRIFLWVFVITIVLNFIMAQAIAENTFNIKHIDNSIQIILSSLFGLIPNCAASITLIESFLKAGLTFGAVVAGLSSGVGFGHIALFKDSDLKTAIKVTLICLFISIIIGFVISYAFPGIKA